MAAVAKRLEQELAEKERETDQLRTMLKIVREIGEDGLAALAAMYAAESGTVVPIRPANGTAPAGREAVRKIIRERPGLWTFSQLRAEMVERGWYTSDKGLEAACNRLCRINKEGRRVGKGRYVFPADYSPEVIPGFGQEGGAIAM